MVKVETALILAFAVNVVVVVILVMHLAVRTDKLGPIGPEPDPGFGAALPDGRTLEEYVHAGLVDLRIMLAQAARRRPH